MAEYYEPMLYMSSPEHSHTMGVEVDLKEDVDGRILNDVVEALRERYPYFYVRASIEGEDILAIPNSLPMVVRHGFYPIKFNSKESNCHLAAWKYEGKRMAFEINHALTDGAGVFPYVKAALYLYLKKKTGITFNPEGFHLPGEEIPESETGNPMEGLDIDNAKPPVFIKKPIADFYRPQGDAPFNPYTYYLKLNESELMRYCKDYDGSPNSFLAVMIARSLRRIDPKIQSPIVVSIAVDNKAMLGCKPNYRMFVHIIDIDFQASRNLDDLLKACTVVRGQMMAQASYENSLYEMKKRKENNVMFSKAPLAAKTEMAAKFAGSVHSSAGISYANSRSFGPLDPYIEAIYVLAEPGGSDILCEVSCINQHFYLAIAQSFTSDRFIQQFIKEFSAIGLECELLRQEPCHLCGIDPFIAKEQK